jgi:hypothetical protein
MAKAARDAKGPEVIPSDNEDKFSDEGMEDRPPAASRPQKSQTTLGAKTPPVCRQVRRWGAQAGAHGGTPSPRKKARDEEDSSVDRLDRKKAFPASKGRHGVNDASNAEAKVLIEDDSDDNDASGRRPCRKTRAAKGGRSADNPADRADDERRPTKVPSMSGRGVPTHAAIGRRGVPVHAISRRGVPAGTPHKNV